MKLEVEHFNFGIKDKNDIIKFKVNLVDYKRKDFHYMNTDCSCTRIVDFDKNNGVISGEIVCAKAGVGELEKFLYIYEKPEIPYYKATELGVMTVNLLKPKHRVTFSFTIEK